MTNRADDCNRANSASTPNPPSDAAGNYILSGAFGGTPTVGITGNTLYIVVADNGDDYVMLESSVTAIETEATLVNSASGSTGIINRFIDSDTCILGLANTGGGGAGAGAYEILERTGGSYNGILFTGGVTVTLPLVLKLRSDSSNLHTIYAGGVSQGSASSAVASTGTKHGVRGAAANDSFDAISITGIGGASAGGPIVGGSILRGAITGGRIVQQRRMNDASYMANYRIAA